MWTNARLSRVHARGPSRSVSTLKEVLTVNAKRVTFEGKEHLAIRNMLVSVLSSSCSFMLSAASLLLYCSC